MHVRSHAFSGLLIAGVIAMSTGCGLIDKDEAKDKDRADKNAASTAPSASASASKPATDTPVTGAPNSRSPESGSPKSGIPGGGTGPDGRDYCSLITSADLKAASGVEVTRTRNDTALNVCRYYGPADKPLLDVQFFWRSQGPGDTPESVLTGNSLAEYGTRVTDLGDFPTMYFRGSGAYPAPSTPEYYFAKTRGTDLIVDVHVRVQPEFKGMERARHTAIAKHVAESV